MKKILILIISSFLIVSCHNNDNENIDNSWNNNENNKEIIKYESPSLEDIVKNIEKEAEDSIESTKNLEKSWNIEENTENIDNNSSINKEVKEDKEITKDDDEDLEEEFYWYNSWAVNVKFNVKKLVDYNTCILSKSEFDNLENKKWYEYPDLCAPKYKFIWNILAWNPEKIEFYSCLEEAWYTLQKFTPWDKIFEYNIAEQFDNICQNEDQRSYEMKYYNKDGKQLDEVNAFKDILPEEFIYKKAWWLYFWNYAIRWNCLLDNKAETQICYDNETKTLK